MESMVHTGHTFTDVYQKISGFSSFGIKSSEPMNKRLLFSLAFGCLLAIGAAVYVWFFVYNKPHRDIEAAVPDFTMDAQSLIGEFDANDTASDRKFNDKVIRFSGTLKKVEPADTTVTLVFDYGTGHIITAQVLPKYKTEMEGLNPGATVTVKGLYNGFLAGDTLFGLPGSILLNKCSPDQ